MSGYVESVLVLLAINTILAYGAFLPMIAGQLNLGVAAFVAIGAYGGGYLSNALSVHPALAALGGLSLAGLLKDRSDPEHLDFSPGQLARYFDEFDKDSPDRLRPRETLSPLIKREINTGLYDIARREMNEMATRSGGHEYAVKALDDLNGVYKQIADDLRSQYSLSYYPTNRRHDGRWRQVRVEVKHEGATVRTRTGYRAPEK